MARMTEVQIRNEVKKRVADMIRLEGATFDPNILDTIDVKSIINQVSSEWAFVVWDHVSPINGVDAQTVIARYDVQPDDAVYLVKHLDQVVYFQPFQPNVSGKQKMTLSNVNSIASSFMDEVVNNIIMDTIFPLLVVQPTPPPGT